MTNKEHLSEEQTATFEELKDSALKTSRNWVLVDLFRDFYEQWTVARGRTFFQGWYAWASRCRLRPMVKVAKMIKRHFERIVTWFEHRISNASAEGFNSRTQGQKFAARGLRNFENYRTRILFFCGKLNLLPESLAQ